MKKIAFFMMTVVGVLVSVFAFAEEVSAPASGSSGFYWACAIGAGMIMGVASGLGALGQGKAAAAALEGMARNPQASDKLFTPLILSLALMESLVLFSFAIAFLLQNKVPGLAH